MTFKTYNAIRRVTRLQYLFIVLRNAGVGYQRDKAKTDIQEAQANLEVLKAKILGKRKPRPVGGEAVLRETEKMAMQMRYAVRSATGLSLTRDGELLLEKMGKDESSSFTVEAREMLITRFWQVYPIFSRTILSICSQSDGKMDLPLPSDESFNSTIQEKYKLSCDAITFKVIREIGAGLELLNWYIFEEGEQRLQRVYAISCVSSIDNIRGLNQTKGNDRSFCEECQQKLGRMARILVNSGKTLEKSNILESALENSLIAIQNNHGIVLMDKIREIEMDKFEEQLWISYLKLVNYRQMFPVMYPDLRNQVSFSLRISDNEFDMAVINLIKSPGRITIYPSVGVLDYSRKFSYLHKYLPPRTKEGKFISFLKIKRN